MSSSISMSFLPHVQTCQFFGLNPETYDSLFLSSPLFCLRAPIPPMRTNEIHEQPCESKYSKTMFTWKHSKFEEIASCESKYSKNMGRTVHFEPVLVLGYLLWLWTVYWDSDKFSSFMVSFMVWTTHDLWCIVLLKYCLSKPVKLVVLRI